MRFNRALRGLAVVIAAFCAVESWAIEPTGRERVEVAWHDGFTSDRGWALEPSRAGRASGQSELSFSTDGLSIQVPAGAEVVIARTTNPIWVQSFPFMEVACHQQGGGAPASLWVFMSDDSTGPITPDALNPENPLAGEHEALVGPFSTGGTHLVDLRGRYPSDRVARLELRIKGGDAPATLRISRLAFRACDLRSPAPQATQPATPFAALKPSATTGESAWSPLALPKERTVSAAELAWALGGAGDWPAGQIECDGLPFALGAADRAALASGLMEHESLKFAGGWSGSELALLLATRAFGNDGPWHSPGSLKGRGDITSPHRLAVRLTYADGSTCTCFPWSLRRKAWSVGPAAQAYVVPLDPGKRLVRFAVAEQMNYGQAFLLGASINTSATPAFPEARPDRALSPRAIVKAPPPSVTQWKRDGDRLVFENAWNRLVCRADGGLAIEQLELVPFARQIIAATQPAPLLEVLGEDGRPLALQLVSCEGVRKNGAADVHLRWAVGGAEHALVLQMLVEDSGTVCLRPTLQNTAGAAWNAGLRYAQLRNCAISPEPSDRRYLLGTRNALLSGEPISVQKEYGGPWPLPLVDLFAEQAGGGLGLIVADPDLLPKKLEFKQHEGGADLAIRLRDVSVPAGGKLDLPTAVLMTHAGDWHDLFRVYRAVLKTKFPQSPKRLTDAFFCRRDYPLGGTGYLFDPHALRYTPERLIAEGQAFGGIQFIDISGWAFNRKTGRVGDYLTNDLGGLDELRRMAEGTHAAGLKLGLYFEGYLIDKRSKLAAKALPAWQRIDRAGKPVWWSGEMEFFACPGAEAWRRELAAMITTVAKHTGADAVYVDEFGLLGQGSECWSAEHGHPVPSNPIQDQRAMLRTIHEALDRESLKTAIYIEFTPPDGLMDLVDAAFDYGLSDIVPGRHPASLPLYRYAFPQLASYEMVSQGIRPVPAEVDDLHRCIFHGIGVWLKGRADSWYSPQFRELAKAARPVFEGHAEVLHAEACEPLIPTLQRDLYANRFAGRDRTIVTLYNAGSATASGPLISVQLPENWTATELLSGQAAHVVREDRQATIHGRVEPHSTVVLLLGRPAARDRQP